MFPLGPKKSFVRPATVQSSMARITKKKAVQKPSAQRKDSAKRNRSNPPKVRHCHAPPCTDRLTAWRAQFTMLYVFSLCSILAGLTGEIHFLTTMQGQCQLLNTMLCLISLNQKPSLPLKLALTLACERIPTNKGKRDIL